MLLNNQTLVDSLRGYSLRHSMQPLKEPQSRDSGNNHFVPQIVRHFCAVSVYLMVNYLFCVQTFPETLGHEIYFGPLFLFN